MALDVYSMSAEQLMTPGAKIVPVTASDSADLTDGPCRALLVGTAGAATIDDLSGATRTAVPLQQGFNPIGARRVYANGLEASNIWALY